MANHWRNMAMAVLALAASGCASMDAYKARFREPQYVLTPELFRQAPQRVGILPFASRSHKTPDLERAELCRRAFYQHFALLDYEDVEMSRFDRVVLDSAAEAPDKPIKKLFQFIRAIDLLGMTSLVDIREVFADDPIFHDEINELLGKAARTAESDALAIGISRSYGRLYAVVFSTIGISTRVELRDPNNGALLWRGEDKYRNYQFPISLNPIDIPYLLWYTWANSRGVAMDMMAYRVFRDITATIPYLDGPVNASVETTGARARLYKRPSLWTWRAVKRAPGGQRMTFMLARNGWFQARDAAGEVYWIERRDARLVNDEGEPIALRRSLVPPHLK